MTLRSLILIYSHYWPSPFYPIASVITPARFSSSLCVFLYPPPSCPVDRSSPELPHLGALSAAFLPRHVLWSADAASLSAGIVPHRHSGTNFLKLDIVGAFIPLGCLVALHRLKLGSLPLADSLSLSNSRISVLSHLSTPSMSRTPWRPAVRTSLRRSCLA